MPPHIKKNQRNSTDWTPGALTRRRFLKAAAFASQFTVLGLARAWSASRPIFSERGYYLLPCRTPTLGYRVYRDLVDDLARDHVNTLILWLGGAFRSRRYPVTWQYNSEHINVRQDFMRRLIRHAHGRGIRCLLGFTPFGYDGVNQYAMERPDLKATGPDGKPVSEFGIHCWGWNLCPAKPDSQGFMLDYVAGEGELVVERIPLPFRHSWNPRRSASRARSTLHGLRTLF